MASLAEVTRLPITHRHAFRHLYAPGRLGWWIALLFGVGSLCFGVAAAASAWPDDAPTGLRTPAHLAWIFFVGSLFFTGAAWLQWLEALNHDVAEAFEEGPRHWRWLGWRPRNLGYLASAIQLVGTLLFNLNTADALRASLPWREQDLLIWTPDMLGSICFLAASSLAYAEVSHGGSRLALRSISWWITVVNLAGSVAFQLAAFASSVGPAATPPGRLFAANALTALGALCFGVGAYLLVPELFDTAEAPDRTAPRPSSGLAAPAKSH